MQGSDPVRGSRKEMFQKRAGRVGSGEEVLEISRVGSGRVGSGLEMFKYNGTGRVALTQPDPRDGVRPVERPEKNATYTTARLLSNAGVGIALQNTLTNVLP